MEFLPIKNSLGFLLLPGENWSPPSSPRPPAAGSHPTTPSRFLGGYLHADTFRLLRCLVESGPLAVCTARFKRTVISGEGGGRGGWRVSSPSHPVAQDCAMTVLETRAQLAEEVLRKGFSFPPFLFRGEERDEFIVFFTVRGLSKRTFRII